MKVLKEFFFCFGYHHPDAWCEIKKDPDFEYESTGIFKILSYSETEAKNWGITLAKWYLTELHKPEVDYIWSPLDYAVWVTDELPDGFEKTAQELEPLKIGTYPEFEIIKRIFYD